ncbi:MAG: alpha/beta fold hydrolase [Dehalococcoidia bacterium]
MTTGTELTEESTSRFVQAGSFKLHYNEAGSGPALILLHGGVAGSCGWNNFAWSLPLLARSFRAMAVDLPNNGKSDAVALTEPASLANARAVKDMLDSLGIEKAYLAGNTQAVREFAIEWPERTLGIACIGGGATGQSIFVPRNPDPSPLQLAQQKPSEETIRGLAKFIMYDASRWDDQIIAMTTAYATNPEQAKARGESFRGAGRDLLAESAKVTCPALAIFGRDDRQAALDGSLRLLWALPDSELHIWSKAGHFPHVDQPEKFARLLEYFFLG